MKSVHQISRLLDNMTDEELDDQFESEEDLEVGVEDLLHLAIEERKGKQEAKKVLMELQANYDELQKKFADAENTIDRLR